MTRRSQLRRRRASCVVGRGRSSGLSRCDRSCCARARSYVHADDAPPELIVIAQSRPGRDHRDGRSNCCSARRRWPASSRCWAVGAKAKRAPAGRGPACRDCIGTNFPPGGGGNSRCARRPLSRLGAASRLRIQTSPICGLRSQIDNPQSQRHRGVDRAQHAAPRNGRRPRRCLAIVPATPRFGNRQAADRPVVRGAAAGIWDGGQLDDREADDLGRVLPIAWP